ncbi:hypothetical protein RUM44_010158 [Polyplax serrata]|uniref:Uncharacterized protein n=1 Tax=Polyplax serrata TaxID=468196 RepID=A0ABR1AUQ5_POLSC
MQKAEKEGGERGKNRRGRRQLKFSPTAMERSQGRARKILQPMETGRGAPCCGNRNFFLLEPFPWILPRALSFRDSPPSSTHTLPSSIEKEISFYQKAKEQEGYYGRMIDL